MTIDLNIFNFRRQPIDPSDQSFEVNVIQELSSEHCEDEEADIRYNDRDSELDEVKN